jgi:hypothetical protein
MARWDKLIELSGHRGSGNVTGVRVLAQWHGRVTAFPLLHPAESPERVHDYADPTDFM